MTELIETSENQPQFPVISNRTEGFYPVGTIVELSPQVQKKAETKSSFGIVQPVGERGCCDCILIALHRCSEYLPCYPDIRNDNLDIYLAAWSPENEK